jgi:two-component system alkaline phosphatase synthesis response regulator PhoP
MPKKKVSVVDDDPSLLELISAVLEQEGYDIETYTNGEDFLKTLKTSKPDIVLLDMMMPGMSGREVCEKVREDPETKDVKIIFVTVAKFSETGKETLEKMNVQDYVTKPFDNTDLVNRIKKVIG